ncbi:cyclase/dehydrase [Cryphonectria parasitica EP155]|uniref:Cyclase/dehydrase n=1 Tax=Cryphonectria parasitica (strain ATCC 38755 / EP155) TaxID=660469 RepID=A0A9P5CTV6_CRYP1|nr:cyclase/dehydrase [Cryphonectria parasitica EP155]KAF3771049.1 cyclase/dehydrase [Cryphonectria parasitica EP155]
MPRSVHRFNTLLSDQPLAINVTRTLPYPRERLYDLIADVDSYSQFLPYCQHSRVTAWSRPDDTAAAIADPQHRQRRWPVEGELTIGFGPVTQSYTSRIVCVPGRSVEALSGKDEPEVARKDGEGKNPFKRLVTKWTVEDAPVPRAAGGKPGEDGEAWTKVDLDLSMRLEDPLVQVMLSKVVDESAAKMIDAFEQRARQLFGSAR